MYHSRFKNSHYKAGYHYGQMLLKNNKRIDKNQTFVISEERKAFAKKCLPYYQEFYPEILEEIKGIAEGQNISYEDMYTFLLSMYCFEFNNKCTCFAFSTENEIILGRNSDFLVALEKLYMNCLYSLDDVYAFNGNTTAFIEMEDGVNEYGLAVGLTFVYPYIIQPGLNAGMLVRYLLEKCQTTDEAIVCLKRLPIASSQTLTIADKQGHIVIVECNCEHVIVIDPNENENFVVTTNHFHSQQLKKYINMNIDDWKSHIRYDVTYHALKNNSQLYSLEFAKDILRGEYGFMCQYDRKTGADTVWSVVYDIKNKKIWRVEGNPSRKEYKEDQRFKWR